jgi:hypothetical protein
MALWPGSGAETRETDREGESKTAAELVEAALHGDRERR